MPAPKTDKFFSLLVKPVSFDCNLRCRYCFYLGKEALFGSQRHCMSDTVLEAMIVNYLQSRQEVYSLAWQGGEPTLAGVDFFRRAVGFMEKHGQRGVNFANVLQTNGTLLDDAWGEFLAEYHFLVGVSVDGPEACHDLNRRTADGRGTHAAVLRGLDVLRRHGVEFNILTLVNSATVREPLAVYRYLRDELGVAFHQYIECVEYDDAGKLMPYAVTAEQWGDFLCQIFDEWHAHDQERVSVRLFDTILHKLLTDQADTCAASRECDQYLVVEHDGGVYPCDFFVQPDLKLGNVLRQPLAQALSLPRMRAFAQRKAKRLRQCRSCEFNPYCAGDCLKNRFQNASLLCEGWKKFYSHALGRLKQIAADLQRRRAG
ncbi:MAG TPA: anaerobic sulfatase maturase [Lentisphaeria bacterium]|nr:anaerobic sulfatase maturase [Lentisphaeria bacterium]